MLGQLKVKTSFIFNLFFDADQDLYVVQNNSNNILSVKLDT